MCEKVCPNFWLVLYIFVRKHHHLLHSSSPLHHQGRSLTIGHHIFSLLDSFKVYINIHTTHIQYIREGITENTYTKHRTGLCFFKHMLWYRVLNAVFMLLVMFLHGFLQTYVVIYSGENKYLNPCRFRKFGHLQRNVWSIIVIVGVF